MGKVAQGVQLQDRAQALSLPIHTLALVNGAAHLATKLAARVGDAVGFDEVLHEGVSVAPGKVEDNRQTGQADGVSTVDDLIAKISQRIRALMEEAGMSANGELKIHLTSGSNLLVEDPRPDRAGIEELLNRNPGLKQDFETLSNLAATNEFSIDLTSPVPPANMSAPGGYPNW